MNLGDVSHVVTLFWAKQCASTNLKVHVRDHAWNKCRDGSQELGVHNGPFPYGSSLPLDPSVGIKQIAGLIDAREPLLFKEMRIKAFRRVTNPTREPNPDRSSQKTRRLSEG